MISPTSYKKKCLQEMQASKDAEQTHSVEGSNLAFAKISSSQMPTAKVEGEKFDGSIKDQLPEDLNILKALNGDEERNEYKASLIEKYRDYAEAQLSKKNWAGDNLLANWYMWQLDVSGIEDMWQQMINAIEHGISGPSQIKRDMPALFLDAVHDFTVNGINSGKDFNTDIIKQAIDDLNIGNYVTNSALKSKLYALHGKVCFSECDYAIAIKSLETATQLNQKAGVKTLLKEAKQKLTEMTDKDGADHES